MLKMVVIMCRDFVLENLSTASALLIYFVSLNKVDVPRAVYFMFCILSFIFPSIRPLMWRILMWYTSAITVMFYVVCILMGPQLETFEVDEKFMELFGLTDYGIRWCARVLFLTACKRIFNRRTSVDVSFV